ncbi:MAG TPA: peptidase domain-containing ABC transporter [Niastella sp.]
MKRKVPVYKQADAMDCGPTCLKMIAAFYGRQYPLQHLRQLCKINRQGVSMAGIMEAAETIGLKTLSAELPLPLLIEKAPLPCLLHWERNHFVVLSDINDSYALVADPSVGKTVRYTIGDLSTRWLTEQTIPKGRALFLEPGEGFHQHAPVNEQRLSLWSLWPYVYAYRNKWLPVIFTILVASVCSLLIPSLTKAVVDKGVQQKQLSVIWMIGLGQLLLFAGRMTSDYLRARWLYKTGAGISIQLLQNFLTRLTQLPLSFFDNRHGADNLQRVNDNQRIEEFLTNWVVTVVVAVVTLLVLGIALFYYNPYIFLLFMTGSIITTWWSASFKEKRYVLDQQKFKMMAASQQVLLEVFSAMQEIKLTGSENNKKQQWQALQENAISLKLESLRMDQWIQGSGALLNEIKNVVIICTAAMFVVNQQLTFGGMLAISYICGQMNTPVMQLAEFIKTSQNALFSLQRMQEVHNEPVEDTPTSVSLSKNAIAGMDIRIHELSFRYGLQSAPFVLNELSLTIPAGKVTAIVGMSGSGKTTLLKLLLKFYDPTAGHISIGDIPMNTLSAANWRSHCGVVMQDGYVFMDTVANNIYAGANERLPERLHHASRLANMHDFFMQLPFGYETVIGRDGYGLSKGQIQRLLIARLIYKDPSFIFLDEATNALDTENEKEILYNLHHFFPGKTVVVVAHRLSTVRHAHNIVVLEKGIIKEQGNHEELTALRGTYYKLIRNQLELDA